MVLNFADIPFADEPVYNLGSNLEELDLKMTSAYETALITNTVDAVSAALLTGSPTFKVNIGHGSHETATNLQLLLDVERAYIYGMEGRGYTLETNDGQVAVFRINR